MTDSMLLYLCSLWLWLIQTVVAASTVPVLFIACREGREMFGKGRD